MNFSSFITSVFSKEVWEMHTLRTGWDDGADLDTGDGRHPSLSLSSASALLMRLFFSLLVSEECSDTPSIGSTFLSDPLEVQLEPHPDTEVSRCDSSLSIDFCFMHSLPFPFTLLDTAIFLLPFACTPKTEAGIETGEGPGSRPLFLEPRHSSSTGLTKEQWTLTSELPLSTYLTS